MILAILEAPTALGSQASLRDLEFRDQGLGSRMPCEECN